MGTVYTEEKQTNKQINIQQNNTKIKHKRQEEIQTKQNITITEKRLTRKKKLNTLHNNKNKQTKLERMTKKKKKTMKETQHTLNSIKKYYNIQCT